MSDSTAAEPGAFAGWVAAERGRFAVWLPVFMALGAALYFSLRSEIPPASGAIAGGVALVVARFARAPWLRVPAVLAVAAMLGMAAAQFATWRAAPLADLPRKASIVTGKVRAVEQLPNGRRVTLERASLDGGAAQERLLRIRLRAGDETPLSTGDTIEVRAMLSRPAPPAFPGAWDFQRDAFFAGFGGYGFALRPVTLRTHGAAEGLAARIQALREAIIARAAAALPAERAAIAATLLTGGTSSIPEADRAAFRDSGLAHLLAIAGLHIGIVMAWVFGTTRLLLALSERAALSWPLKQLAALTALAAGLFYMVLTSAHVPIMRSFAMAALVTLGVIIGRRALSLRGLGFAMAVLVLVAPHEVMGVSFQMSFSAVLALIAGYEALRPLLHRLRGNGSLPRRLLGHVVALALTSALAGTASTPYGAYHFGHAQLYYVFANMIAVPLTALWVMPAGMLALLLMPLQAEGPAFWAMGWGIEAVLYVGRAVAAWPEAVVAVPHLAPWGLLLISLGLAWLGIWRTRIRLFGLTAILAGAVSPLFAPPPDIVVSADARLIGLRTTEGIYIIPGKGGSKLIRDSWRQLWGTDAQALPLPVGRSPGGTMECARNDCIALIDGRKIRVLRGQPTCDAILVLSPEPLRFDCADPPPFIDRFSVWRHGAHAAWVTPSGANIRTDRDERGVRPWIPRMVSRSAVPPGMPPAARDDVPEE
ncbi:MAG: ComEC/Rec2 family competence protein [Alphaproteobacteria bacterium]|nr:ComEC/Rec2 family competence protein [Alphaproteobacteria bacterium]